MFTKAVVEVFTLAYVSSPSVSIVEAIEPYKPIRWPAAGYAILGK
jgi:hypothetical protein